MRLRRFPTKAVFHRRCFGAGDAAHRSCYEAVAKRTDKAIIPPRRSPKIWQHGNCKAQRLARDENLRRIRHVGRTKWKRASGYHRRSLAETAMLRLKTISGGCFTPVPRRLRTRKPKCVSAQCAQPDDSVGNARRLPAMIYATKPFRCNNALVLLALVFCCVARIGTGLMLPGSSTTGRTRRRDRYG